MHLSEIGKLAETYWNEIPVHFPFVVLGEFIVMPNHVHGIIIIDKPSGGRNDTDAINNCDTVDMVKTRHCLVSTTPNTIPQSDHEKTIGQKRYQNQGKNTLSSIIGSYKSVVTKNAWHIDIDFAWQSRFHEHIVRNDKSFQNISAYIKNNPFNWKGDKFHAK